MARKSQLTPADRAQKGKAGFRHGMYVLRDRGESAMTPAGRSRLIELKEQFMTEPGRVEYRQELAAHIALMLEIGFGNVREVAEAGGSIWTSSPVKGMGCYLNTLVRLLDGWPKEQALQDITTILQGGNDDTEDTED